MGGFWRSEEVREEEEELDNGLSRGMEAGGGLEGGGGRSSGILSIGGGGGRSGGGLERVSSE